METAALVLPEPERHSRIASPIHTIILISVQAGLLYLGKARAHSMATTGTTDHISLYVRTMAVEWLLLGFVILGVWRAGSPLHTVLGERWRTAGQFGRDLGIAVLFLIASIMLDSTVGSLLHGDTPNRAVHAMLPAGGLEMVLWVALSLTAGICEEAIYRGYLQKQFMALTQNVPAGIMLSAAAFGTAHLYQGWQQATQIGLLGAMGGILAYWRRSTRPGMIAHTLQDVLGGFIRHG